MQIKKFKAKTLKEAIGIFEKCGTRFYLGWAHRLLGEIFSKTSANNTAEHFEKSIDILKNIKAEGELAHTYASYGRWYLNQKNLHYAKIYLTKAHEIFERIETLNQIEEIRNELDF